VQVFGAVGEHEPQLFAATAQSEHAVPVQYFLVGQGKLPGKIGTVIGIAELT